MDGSSTLECLDTGEWSSEFPVCEMITCSPPVDIEYGIYTVRGVTEIPIKTEPLQQIQQQQSRKTKYSRSARLVSLIEENQIREGILYNFGELVEYSCHEGYSMNTEGIMTCTENGWDSPAPVCRAINCPIPISIRNGQIIGDDVTFGAVLEYSCNEGYDLIGEQIRTCQSNKEWSDEQPYCRIVECSRPAHLEHGAFEGDSIKYKSVLSYTCEPGFHLEGNAIRSVFIVVLS